MYTESTEKYLIVLYGTEIPVEASLFEPEFSKPEVAKMLNCSVKSIERYLTFGSDYISELQKYFTKGFLNGLKISSSDIVFLEEIQDLKKRFSHERVKQILTRKYSNQ